MYDDKGNNKKLIDLLKNTLHCLINKYKEDKMTELGVYYIESCLKTAKKYLDDFSMERKDEFISDMERYAYIDAEQLPILNSGEFVKFCEKSNSMDAICGI